MKALTYDRYGGPDVVEVKDVPRPTPKADQVLVRVHASAVNTADYGPPIFPAFSRFRDG